MTLKNFNGQESKQSHYERIRNLFKTGSLISLYRFGKVQVVVLEGRAAPRAVL